MYESTMKALEHLYDKVSDGGFVIVDDYGALPNCRAAVEDFGGRGPSPGRYSGLTGPAHFGGKANLRPPIEQG